MSRSPKDLIERLQRIGAHDWRVSHLAHTSDTAKEAAHKIAVMDAVLQDALAALDKSQDFICGIPEHDISVAAGNELTLRKLRALQTLDLEPKE